MRVWSGLIFLLWFVLHKYSINNCVSIVFQGSNLLICIQYIINQTFLVQKNKLSLTLLLIFYIPCLFIHDIFSIGIKFLRPGIPFLKIMWQINPEFMTCSWCCESGTLGLFTAQIDVAQFLEEKFKVKPIIDFFTPNLHFEWLLKNHQLSILIISSKTISIWGKGRLRETKTNKNQ